ncbi:MAG: hypothetical protein MJE68_07750 [Proteobacteria bacterium]|nr:hypothetical protein [Pseudomonadota bacterium]
MASGGKYAARDGAGYFGPSSQMLLNLLNQMIIIVYSFLATGDSFWTLHIRFRRGVSTIAQAVYEVSEAIWTVLHPIYMKAPTMEDWRQIEH